MPKAAFLFLNGTYQRGDKTLVRRLIKSSRSKPLLIAVDGGLKFSRRCQLPPDIWLTDMDSAPNLNQSFMHHTEILEYPSDKDKTDTELALDYCISKKISDLTFFGWYDSNCETDHLIGNLFLVNLLKGNKSDIKITFLDSRQQVFPLCNSQRILNRMKGCRLSIIPLDSSITLTTRGTKYRANRLVIKSGQTISLRNQITAQRASVAVSGKALVIIAS